ncbi:hypothetical protein DL95DRAFT_500568, partial [Leptodontidium sp. 2 PMI_412]
MLWCTGIPGAGKTVQCSLVVNYLSERFQYPNFVGYVYFDMKPYHPVDIVCSLIKQFVASSGDLDVSVGLKALYLANRDQNKRPTLGHAAKMLAGELRQAKRVFLVFDAVDEYPNHTEEFVYDLMVKMSINHINVFMTSRAPLSSQNFFEDALKLEIRTRDEDMTAYILDRLSTSTSLARQTARQTELRDVVIKEINEKASGM